MPSLSDIDSHKERLVLHEWRSIQKDITTFSGKSGRDQLAKDMVHRVQDYSTSDEMMHMLTAKIIHFSLKQSDFG